MTRLATILTLLSALALVSVVDAQEPGPAAEEETLPSEGSETSSDAEAADSTEADADLESGAKESTAESEAGEEAGTERRIAPGPSVPTLPRPDRSINPVSRPRAVSAQGKAITAQPSRAAAAADRTAVAPCGEKPRPAGAHTFVPGESLVFDIDIMGVRAGTLSLSVDEPSGGGHSFTASTNTNTFFANVRQVEGRATSFSRDAALYPSRYREDSVEDGVEKWSEVLFPAGREEVDVRFGIGQRERRVRYPVTDTPMDVISLIYYLRTLELAVGDEFCLDVYANRRVWRIAGEIGGEEFVRTPAGGFETWHLVGKAQRMDRPTFEKEIHVWIAQDESRTPVAAMTSIDLGPVRARLSRREGPGAEQTPAPGGGRW